MKAVQAIPRLIIVILLAALTGACSFGTFVSGGGAMRVEVDVYKGPLAKEPAIQLGELVAVLHELERSLFLYDEGLLAARTHDVNHDPNVNRPELGTLKSEGREDLKPVGLNVVDGAPVSGTMDKDNSESETISWASVFKYNKSYFDRGEWCDDLQESDADTIWTLYSNESCLIAAQIHYDVHGLKEHLSLLTRQLNPYGQTAKITAGNYEGTWLQLANCLTVKFKGQDGKCEGADKNIGRDEMVSALQDIAWLAGRLQVKVQYWTQAHVVLNPGDRLTRGRIVTFINLMSQYSAQLSNRADVLLKQLDSEGEPRFDPLIVGKLPLSVYLRDTELSDSLNLYVWNRAAALATFEDMLYHPIESFSSEETADRVRTAERVFDDQNWHRINEVFASGRGEVNLVLVKDGIGNWTLKTFDSDPSELLAAYTQLAKTALQALAKTTSPDVGVAKSILQTVAAPDKDPAEAVAETDEMIAKLRSYYVNDLRDLQAESANMLDNDKKQKTEDILRRYRSALKDIRRLSLAGKLPGGGSKAEPE
jgi:hypothetical protein